jgi:hypothetical protein
MPKRRDILAIVLIVLPWTLLITVWHQSTLAPLLAVHKGEPCPQPHLVQPTFSIKRSHSKCGLEEFLFLYTELLGGTLSIIRANDLALWRHWSFWEANENSHTDF